jgi:endothelin-converting enzyme/putative endopeptidase
LQTILSENNVSAWKEYEVDLNGSTGLFVQNTVDAANFDFYGKITNRRINQTKP